MKVGQIVERAQQISEIGKRGKLKSYYFTHIDALGVHTHVFTQTRPDSGAFEWLSQMGFFFSFVIKRHNLYRSISTSCDSYHILQG